MTIIQSLGVALLGILVVMAVLAVLALLITLMSKVVGRFSKPQPVVNEERIKPLILPQVKQEIPQSQSVGQLTLINTDEPTAAMVMAIVADSLQEPLNRLRFKSIKCLEELE